MYIADVITQLTYLSLFSSGKGRVREKLWVNTSRPLACMVFTNQSTGIPLQRNQKSHSNKELKHNCCILEIGISD